MRPHPFLFALLAGCSNSSSTPSAKDASADSSLAADSASVEDGAILEDAAMTDGSTSDDAGPPCNSVANDAPVVDIVQIAADPPAPQGGTIVDGTYWQTAVSIYTGPRGPAGGTGTSQMTALIQGETVQLVNTGQPERRTVTLTTSDASFTSLDTCPDSQTEQGGYTATTTALTIFLPGGTDDAGPRTVVETLTKQ